MAEGGGLLSLPRSYRFSPTNPRFSTYSTGLNFDSALDRTIDERGNLDLEYKFHVPGYPARDESGQIDLRPYADGQPKRRTNAEKKVAPAGPHVVHVGADGGLSRAVSAGLLPAPGGRRETENAALVAVMRKLLHAIVGMFRHDQPYDGARLCPPVGAAVR